ncbi:MAG: cytochrome c, class [Nitrosospira multiformis]|jgi:mono/diheme cytochrome c family protein|nr:cytochrome c, class [Nitrosospira multiformis]
MTRKKPMGRGRSFALVLTPIVLAFVLDAMAQLAPENPASVPGTKWKNGAEVYAKICGYCHEDGKVGPLILGRELPPAYIRAVVRNGSRAMPPFRFSEIDDESLTKLAEYISKSSPSAR